MKRRRGFVSNSSSSSFVLFGVELTHEQVGKMAVVELEKRMIKEYGDVASVPTGMESWTDEAIFLRFQEDPESIEGECSYELGELAGVLYADEYIGYMVGFHPTWFRENPDKTFNDAVAEYTEKLLEIGLTQEEIVFSYIEEEITN